MIFFGPGNIASAEEEETSSGSFWNDMVAKGDSFSWKEVFAMNEGEDIYMMLYKKSLEYPQKNALREIAGNNGLTTDEAQAVIDGSITPIFNNPNRRSTQLTQEEAFGMANDIQDDFLTLKSIYEVQQEVDMAIKPSEIFANGDLSDSGFDLIHDLDVIEKIIFLEQTPISVGGLFSEEVDSPVNPVDNQQFDNDFVGSGTPVAINRIALTADEEGNLSGNIALGDEEIPVEVLENDICEAEDPLLAALGDFDETEAAEQAAAVAGGNGDVGDIVGNGNEDEAGDEPAAPPEKLEPAPADPWGSAWCPGLGPDGSSSVSNFSEEGFGDFADSFKSLGGSSPGPMFAGIGAGTDPDNEFVQANAALCITMQLVKQTVSSYQPGDSCLICEVEKINELMDKTLGHTLIPSKVTGNLLESAKCKETNGSLLNLQVITIWNPIPAPPNDKLIFGKNIFEEWDNFTKQYQPLLLEEVDFKTDDAPDTTAGGIMEDQSRNLPAGTTQAELFDSIVETQDQYTAEALKEVKKYENGDTGTNQLLYLRAVLGEMKNMNALFKAYQDIFGKVDKDAIQKIKSKPNIP